MKSILECDRRRMEKFLKFKLPHYVKKIGWAGFIASLLLLIATKFFDSEPILLKEILKKASLVFLLLVVFSKEKIEDELIVQLRAQSFSFAFLAGVLYALLQPFFNWIVFALFKPERARLEDLGDFQILWVMLMVYLMFFHISKRWS